MEREREMRIAMFDPMMLGFAECAVRLEGAGCPFGSSLRFRWWMSSERGEIDQVGFGRGGWM
jgi:hypothetical protein